MARASLNVQTYRIIPSNYPPIGLFEGCTDPDDLDEMFELESITNERLQDQAGDIHRVAKSDRVIGPGSSVLMASFTHIGQPSRFTDGTFGVYYAALDLETAIKETSFWQAKRLTATKAPAMVVDMRSHTSRTQAVVGGFVDLRGDVQVHSLDSYIHSQAKAREHKARKEFGIYYKSVRNPGGECIAALRPNIMSSTVQGKHFNYCWDGAHITDVQEITSHGV